MNRTDFQHFPIAEADEIAKAYRKLAKQLPEDGTAYKLLSFIAKRLEKGDNFDLYAWHGLIPPTYDVGMQRRERRNPKVAALLTDNERRKYHKQFFG